MIVALVDLGIHKGDDCHLVRLPLVVKVRNVRGACRTRIVKVFFVHHGGVRPLALGDRVNQCKIRAV